MKDNLLPFYIERLSQDLNSYEKINRIYLLRSSKTGQLAAWFGLKAATLPYNDVGSSFLIPAVELTHFAVDERFKSIDKSMRAGEFIFWHFILPIVEEISEKIGCKSLFLFAIDNPKLISYYKTVLGFKEINSIDDKQFFEYAAPDYDEGCHFLYFPLV